ncbi:hypothetical protein [Mannheimia indoligenes]|uniref:hypothetical protein n=1 Tax=Mannheimia indoligenes TaxID=3103145 RepID=UPI002FE57878
MKKMLLSLICAGVLSGCVAVDRNVAIVRLQAETANMIGLSSSDEITVSNVNFGESNVLTGQLVTYRATTNKGRTFDCNARIVDGTILSEAQIKLPSCKPLNVYKK